MPWSASVVYLHDTEDARAVLAADPRVSRRVYAVDLAAVDFPPAFDRPGLLAIRSPGSRRQLADLVDGFDWKDLDGALPSQLTFARSGLAGPSSRIAPPDATLRWLEDLAARVAGPVVWYQAEAMASDPDGEIAWVLDWGGTAGAEGVVRAPTVYTRRDRRMVRLGAEGATFTEREPLGAGLLHLGIRLEGPWFTPHRPDFGWEERRV